MRGRAPAGEERVPPSSVPQGSASHRMQGRRRSASGDLPALHSEDLNPGAVHIYIRNAGAALQACFQAGHVSRRLAKLVPGRDAASILS